MYKYSGGIKKNTIVLENIIESEVVGAYNSLLNNLASSINIGKLKKILYSKSREKTGVSREFYYNLSLKLTRLNIKECMKALDSHIYSINSCVTQDGVNSTRTCVTRTANKNFISLAHNSLYARLNKYYYVKSKCGNIITIYIKNKIEYEKNINDLFGIRDIMKKKGIKLKVSILDMDTMVDRLTATKYID